MAPRLSVIVPVLNEAACIREALEALAPLRARGHEVIVVDGASDDGSASLAAAACDRLLDSGRGRADSGRPPCRSPAGRVRLQQPPPSALPPCRTAASHC